MCLGLIYSKRTAVVNSVFVLFLFFVLGLLLCFFNLLCVWVSFIQNELLWKQSCEPFRADSCLNMTPGWSVALTRLTAVLVLSASAPCPTPHIPAVSDRSLNLTLHSIQTITVVIRHPDLCHLSCKDKSTSITMKRLSGCT